MANLGVLIETFSNIIDEQMVKKEILPATKPYKVLNFFFRNGNAGINALRELLEEMNQDTVDVFFETEGKYFECHIYICYKFHDLEIVEYTDNKDTSKHKYEIVDTTRESIENIKKEFKETEL